MYCATMEKVACRSRHLCSKFIDRWICEEHAAQCCAAQCCVVFFDALVHFSWISSVTKYRSYSDFGKKKNETVRRSVIECEEHAAQCYAVLHSAAQCSSTLSDTFHESRLWPNNDPTLILEKKWTVRRSVLRCFLMHFSALRMLFK